jgi:hypothetical protein
VRRGLARRQLEHRLGVPLEGEPAWRHGATQRHLTELEVKEDEVEREAHAEGVDAPAPGEQKSRAGGAAIEKRQPEKPRPP